MKHHIGNFIHDVKEGIIVHGCNAQGVMRSGVAKDIREKWPDAFNVYRNAYEKHMNERGQSLQLGRVIWYTASKEPKLAIANGITQEFYGREPGRVYVNYDALRLVFQNVAKIAKQHNLSVHYPLIGAGLAQGDWGKISSIINEELEGVDHNLWTLPGMEIPQPKTIDKKQTP